MSMMQRLKKTGIGLLCVFHAGFLFGQATTGNPPAAGPQVSDYIRYVETDPAAESKLQTALTRFSKGDLIVDLVAVVHLGDADYYANLDDYLKRYDAVLYELVGGQFSKEALEPSAEIDAVRGLQQMAKAFLGLEFQLENINYEAANFVHADVDWTEYEELMAARNQSFGTIFQRAMALAEDSEGGGIVTDEAAMNAMMNQLVAAVLTGNSSALKRSLAPFLGEAEELITQIEGEDGTVLVTERNKVVMTRLYEVAAVGQRKLAVFYGAGHMPDLEARLLAEGFTKGDTTWADAWTIEPVGVVNGTNPGGSPADLMTNLLSQSPELMEVLQQMSEVLEALQQIEAGQ